MKELFSIGEMAKLFDIRIGTLRYYDDIGLLKPELKDENSGYRYYSAKEFERLNTIKYLRALGMPLKEIEKFFEEKDTKTLKELLEKQQRIIKDKIKDLMTIEKKIENRLIQLENSLNSEFDRIDERYINERKIIMLRKEIPVSDDLEYSLRELERFNNLEPVMFLGKVGVAVTQKNMEQMNFKSFSSIFVFLEEGDTFAEETETLKESLYLTLRFSGTHTKSDFYYKKLLKYMKERGYSLNGDSVEIALIDLGITNDTAKFVTELQIPVKKS